MYSFLAWTSEILLLVLGLFLMIVILLQRGRGGGLAGAFGGTGGQSAFGTKAGDVFTKITIVVAILWVVVSGGSGYFLRAAAEQKGAQFGSAPAEKPVVDPAILEKPDARSSAVNSSRCRCSPSRGYQALGNGRCRDSCDRRCRPYGRTGQARDF
ncbi:MAG: preprotein translocase subunit SecG [Planctomycetaceae bacterium]